MEENPEETHDVVSEDVLAQDNEARDAAAEAKKLSRRRTKTGCLTCRKRRIKCGEEHPICKNCVKSKRECEGYKQPVVFQHPTGDFPSVGYSNHPTHLGGHSYIQGHPPDFLPHLAAADGSFNPNHDPTWPRAFPESEVQRWPYPYQGHTGGTDPGNHWMGVGSFAGHENTHRPEQHGNSLQSTQTYNWQPFAGPGDFGEQNQSSAASVYPPNGHYWAPPQGAPPQQHVQYSFPTQYSDLPETCPPAPQDLFPNGIAQTEGLALTSSSLTVKHDSISPVENETRYSTFGFVQQASFNLALPATHVKTPPKITRPLPPEDEDEDEEDPWDVEIDFADPESVPLSQSQHDLNSMLIKFASSNERRSRTFTTFLDGPSILATYRPSVSASPLNDEKVARIFCHFISVTGQCLSIFERQASQSTMTFSNLPIPAPQKTLWTYTMPSIALHHPALMHAMLAMSALHISKLQETPEEPAIKHYTYAVRRIGKLLGLPRRRHETATLAANLLIGFYEVMASDHSRWNVHLAGAKVLVSEIDFATMTRTIRRMRSRARQNVAGRLAMSYEECLHIVGIPESLLDDKDWEIDEALVSSLTGYHVEYDTQLQPNSHPQERQPDLTAKEIDDYKIKSDLYWWYCKQDTFQSMVSGDGLLMPYRRWIYCPPRGQIGKPDAAYATMDYLVLIMARLTDFGGRDRVRKVKMVKAQGGQWRPPPHFFGYNKPPPMPVVLTPDSLSSTSGPPSLPQHGPDTSQMGSQPPHTGQQGTTASNGSAPPPGPGFYGMMPLPSDPVEMHSAFHAMNASIYDQAFYDPMPDDRSDSSGSSQTLDDDTAAALNEHSEIIKAFDLFFEALGEDHQPLAATTCQPISTPFGPALQYRTYPIACIWAFYYVGRILIHRFHPHMPPAAMVAAGVTAHLSKDYAQNVGRICAGLYYPQQLSMRTGNLNPSLGAALMESTFCLLFAAVQYQDAGQRGWTISKLRDIAQKTGWQTSAAIAAACEVSWEKMGEAGRGPPYKTTMDRNNTDLRVRRKNKMGDGNMKDDEPDPAAGPSLPTYNRDAIHTNQSTRVHWALGILSVEKDIERLNLDKE